MKLVLYNNHSETNKLDKDISKIIEKDYETPLTEKHTAEFQELQAYRKACKQYAKEMLGLGGNNND